MMPGSMDPIALIPAGGSGSRLQPLPLPKELFPVGYQTLTVDGRKQQRPKVIAQYLLEHVRDAGVRDFVVVLGPGKEAVMEYFGSGSRLGISIAYLHNGGVASLPHALDLARPWVGQRTVVFGMPDTIMEPKDAFRRMLTAHRKNRDDLTLGLFPTTTPWKFSMTKFAPDGTVQDIIDKPKRSTRRYTWGAAVWGLRFTELLHHFCATQRHPRREPVLASVFQFALRRLRVHAVPFPKGRYMDIGTVDELDATLKRFHL